MENHFVKYIIVFFLLSLIGACKDDECSGGGGGDLTFVVTTKHHNTPINGCIVKVKYNAKEFPGENGEYDLVLQANPQENFVNVTGLKCGDYYFYATGIDSTLSSADKSVKGGIPYSTEQESGTIQVLLPVTEVH